MGQRDVAIYYIQKNCFDVWEGSVNGTHFFLGGNEKQDKAMAIYVGFPVEYLIIYANAKISVGFSFFCMALGNAPNVSLYLDDP